MLQRGKLTANLETTEAEKGNFYVSALRSCASAAKRAPTARSFTAELTSAAKRGVYRAYACLQCRISPRSFTAQLTSAAKRGVYRTHACLQCRISPRSFTAQLTSAAKRGVYRAYTCLQCRISPRSFIAELISAAKRGVYSAYAVRDFAAELHCGAHLRSEARCLPCMSTAWNSGSPRNFTAELTSAAKRGSTAWNFTAELYLHGAPRRNEEPTMHNALVMPYL